ncbi:MAG: hypothetical protein ABIQ61_01695 [Ornithinibacter sp.]
MRSVSDRTLRRLAWAAFWVLPVAWLLGIPMRYADPRTQGAWSGADVFDLALFGLIVAFPLVGLLVLRQQPRNVIGWLLVGVGLVWGVAGLVDVYAVYGLVLAPGALPGAKYGAGLNEAAWAPSFGLIGTFLILLYPDGHLPSPRWAPVAWMAGVSLAVVTVVIDLTPGTLEEGPVPGMPNPLGWQAGEGVLQVALVIFLPLVPLSILACAAGLVTRFRRSRGVERQQLKWLASAGGVVASMYLMSTLSVLLVTIGLLPQTRALDIFQHVCLLSFVLIPVAIGMAVLRHGLYEIDVVINRALVYASLTAMLLVVYLGSVLLLQLVLTPLTNESDLAVAGSTLGVAALFGPARRRIQRTVDRRFYRSKYDAEVTVDAFATRLRHEVDLDAVGSDLLTAVDSTMQPAHASLWMRS